MAFWKTTHSGVLTLLLVFGSTCQAGAIRVLDTGTPPDPPSSGVQGISLFGGTEVFQHLAVRFTLDQPRVIDRVEAYLLGGVGALTFAITPLDEDGFPDDDAILFAEAIEMDLARRFRGARGWYGLDGLSWPLPAGDYWLALLPDRSFDDSGMPYGAPIPSTAAVVNEGRSQAWHFGGGNHGWLITAIPEPGTAALAAIVWLGSLGRSRR